MQLHELKPKHKRKKKKRVGRGGKKGTYSGRGMKGQKSRAGAKFKPAIREFIKKYPKLRGYRFKPNLKGIIPVNLDILEKNFKKDEIVSPETLLNKGLVRKIKGKMPKVKILAKGEIKKSLVFSNCSVSKTAKEKIEKADGKIE